MPTRIAINGFGRIGRQLTRQLLDPASTDFTLCAVNTIESIETAAHLLRYDSCYGQFPLDISREHQTLRIGKHSIAFYHQNDPNQLPWKELGIDIVLECSGKTTSERSVQHIASGAKKVLITAAAHSPDITLCMGVNHARYNHDLHHVVSGTSCTTNCIAPVAKLIDDTLAIEAGHATFLHSYTNSQPLLDAVGSDLRRSRAAALNIIPTTTSATHQLPLVLPRLKGKFAAIAVRVPTPNTHLADFTVKVARPTTRAEILQIMEEASHSTMKGIVQIDRAQLVSRDIIGTSCSSVIDAENIYVQDDFIKLLIWHDNEFSYCRRIIDLLSHLSASF